MSDTESQSTECSSETINTEDTWSDSVSEHSSDNDFIDDEDTTPYESEDEDYEPDSEFFEGKGPCCHKYCTNTATKFKLIAQKNNLKNMYWVLTCDEHCPFYQ